MTDRTFIQNAQGYGSTVSQVTCQIDGNTVFSGTVTTLDQPWPTLPDPEFVAPPLGWTWQDSADFAGTKQISISVTGSPVLLAQTFANNPYDADANIFMPIFITEVDGVVYPHPFTDAAIDGVALLDHFNPDIPGQWWWCIPAGSTFTATMHVNAASPPESDPQPE
jgi:hypothetical protein